ncbi:thioredoxin domain-containing protein [Viscerimonas tarda]
MLKFVYIACIISFSLVSCQDKSKQSSEEENSISDYERLVENKIDQLTVENLNKQVENQAVYFGYDSLTKIDLKQLASHHKLFLYFSYQTCPPCIEQTIEYIENAFPEYKEDNEIIFIAPDYPGRMKNNCYGKRVLILNNNSLGIPVERENVPFIFTLNENLEINNLHIVNKNNFDKTSDFIKKIKLHIAAK